MDRQERKAAVTAYKERKPPWGIYAIICTATGEAWVGCSRRVDTQKNRIWFQLGLGKSPYTSLQAAWNQHGGREFKFEELERLRDDFPEFERDDELKKRQTLWRSRLQASAI
ncbi:MAG TPA: GIY-YIG nuclease family protein [Methylocystis sp.]|nr:GIY-YIG nuclease family protein [Methylocystis sp.]